MVLLALILSKFLGGDLPKPNTPLKVPRVVGLKLADAERMLHERGLEVGNVRRVEGPAGAVVRTDPPEGSSVVPGTTVTLYVGAQQEAGNEDHGGKGKGKGKGHGDD
jgi:beta-lactam-binding protein with PASTA domain